MYMHASDDESLASLLFDNQGKLYLNHTRLLRAVPFQTSTVMLYDRFTIEWPGSVELYAPGPGTARLSLAGASAPKRLAVPIVLRPSSAAMPMCRGSIEYTGLAS